MNGRPAAGDLPATLRLVYHHERPTPQDIPLEDVYADIMFPPGAGVRPHVALNMVQTLDGATALGGRAWTIGTPVDHYLYRTLHGLVDAVVGGAGTLRAEDVVAGTHGHLRARREAGGLPPAPTAVVLSATAAFADEVYRKGFFTRRDFPSLVLATPRARAAEVERVVAAGAAVEVVPADAGGAVDLEAAFRHLWARGFRRVLAEGGPRLTTSLLRRGLVDEWFLTVTLRLAGEPGAPRLLTEPVALTPGLLSVFHHVEQGNLREMYLRFAL